MNKKGTKNKYVGFISDEHLIQCIANLHKSYLAAKNNVSKKDFYSNKVDTIKLTFDAQFNNISEENIIQSEILRQIDKSINNSIGTFHEQILGGIKGYQMGKLSGFDIKAIDNTLFALFDFNGNNSNFEDCIFDKLAKQANLYKKSNSYYVDFQVNEPLFEKWILGNSEYTVSHKKVFKISGTQFYALLTNQENALNDLIDALPLAIADYNKMDLIV